MCCVKMQKRVNADFHKTQYFLFFKNFCKINNLSTYARHLVHPPKNPDPAVRLPENRINRPHYTGKSIVYECYPFYLFK